MRLPLPLGRKSGQAKAPMESVERLVNGYLENAPQGKEPTPAYGSPGLIAWATGLDGAIRGMLEMTDRLFVVAGTKLYRIATDGAANTLGEIPGSDLVSMASDGTNVVTVSGGEIYVYDGLNLNVVTDPDAPSASGVAWVDGYFVFSETNTDTFFTCELDDPESYDALDFAAAEWKPDILVTPIILRRTLFLAGKQTIEAQQNVGGADFPFQRYQDVMVDVGFAGREAGVVTNDTMYFLASDRTFRRLDGVTAVRISNHDIERTIKGWANPELTVASAHVFEGHLNIVFRNPEGCLIFDQSTELWHERKSFGSDTWRVRHHARCYDHDLFGSATEGVIYRLSADAYDEDGEPLVFQMTTPWAYARGLGFSVDDVEVVAQVGVGSLTLDPKIVLETTRDGVVFENRLERRFGKAGERTRRITFGPQGSADAMALRLTIADPVQRAVLGVYCDIDVEAD